MRRVRYLAVFCSLVCCMSCDRFRVSNLSGVWQYHQPNGEYAEWVMNDKVLWTYSEGYGTWQFDYTLSGDRLILWQSGAPYDTMIVEKVVSDTLWFSKPKFVCYRIKENPAIERLIADDKTVMDTYLKGFRARSKRDNRQ